MPSPGIYLINSTGEATALAVEDGSGDRWLLREALSEADTDFAVVETNQGITAGDMVRYHRKPEPDVVAVVTDVRDDGRFDVVYASGEDSFREAKRVPPMVAGRPRGIGQLDDRGDGDE